MGKIAEFIEKRYSLADLDRDIELALTGRRTATGVNVNAKSVMGLVPYLSGVRLISETIGMVPLMYYKRVMRGANRHGKEKAVDDPIYYLLHDSPNPEMDAVSFKSALQGQVIGWGNAFAEIDWDMANGVPRALWPLDVSKMKVGRDEATKELIYAYTLPSGEVKKLPAFRVFHLTGFSYDGLIGYDTVFLAREALGMAMALEEYGARFFGNGANPGGVLEHPNRLSPEAKKSLTSSWNEAHQGLENQHRLAVLEEGMTYKQISISPENAQFLESRTFSIQEISRLLNITPHKLMELSHATYSNIEHADMEFNKYTMGPWYRRWEQTCNRKLILPGARSTHFFEYLEDALLRADIKTRTDNYRQRFYIGSISPNDIREKENENPIDNPAGDEYYVQTNMIPMSQLEEFQMKGGASASRVPRGYPPKAEAGAAADYLAITKRIAEREKQNIMRALERDPEGFTAWLDDFYRDFADYVKRQYEPVVGGAAASGYAARYIDMSRNWLENKTVDDVERFMDQWEDWRLGWEEESLAKG